MKVKVAQSCLTLSDPMDYTVHGILQARILDWVAFFILQGIFPTQGSNPGLPHCGQILYQLSYKGSLKSEMKINLPSLVLNKSFWILIYTASFSKRLCVKCLRIFSGLLPRIHTRLGSRVASKESGAKKLELALSTRYQGPEE